MDEEQLRGMLRELRDEPVPADSLARVRAGIEGKRSARPRIWIWALVSAAAAVVLLFGWSVRSGPIQAKRALDPVQVANVTEPIPQPLCGAGPQTCVRTHTSAAGHHRVGPRSSGLAPHNVRPEPTPMPPMVRITTDDPDVVIMLVGD